MRTRKRETRRLPLSTTTRPVVTLEHRHWHQQQRHLQQQEPRRYRGASRKQNKEWEQRERQRHKKERQRHRKQHGRRHHHGGEISSPPSLHDDGYSSSQQHGLSSSSSSSPSSSPADAFWNFMATDSGTIVGVTCGSLLILMGLSCLVNTAMKRDRQGQQRRRRRHRSSKPLDRFQRKCRTHLQAHLAHCRTTIQARDLIIPGEMEDKQVGHKYNENDDEDTIMTTSHMLRLAPRAGQSRVRMVPACCAICLAEYEVNEVVVWSSVLTPTALNNGDPQEETMACRHVFHQDCILDWLCRGKQDCPCCRLPFLPSNALSLPPPPPTSSTPNANSDLHLLGGTSGAIMPNREEDYSNREDDYRNLDHPSVITRSSNGSIPNEQHDLPAATTGDGPTTNLEHSGQFSSSITRTSAVSRERQLQGEEEEEHDESLSDDQHDVTHYVENQLDMTMMMDSASVTTGVTGAAVVALPSRENDQEAPPV